MRTTAGGPGVTRADGRLRRLADSATAPPPPPPPVNNAPVITSIRVQGSRANEPASFADLSEAVTVTVDVKDDETPVSQLQLIWSSAVGTFSGSGTTVTWQAPAQGTTPADVTLRLEVVERYGPATAPTAFEHRVSGSATLKLHDSAKEVGDMARQFLLDFSDSTIRDVDYIMRNFSRRRCPQPSDVDNEYDDVTRDRAERRRTDFNIGSVPATVNFGGVCPIRFRRGDACVVVPVFWADIYLPTNTPGSTRGSDIIAAAYAPDDARWWLCASDYEPCEYGGQGVLPLMVMSRLLMIVLLTLGISACTREPQSRRVCFAGSVLGPWRSCRTRPSQGRRDSLRRVRRPHVSVARHHGVSTRRLRRRRSGSRGGDVIWNGRRARG